MKRIFMIRGTLTEVVMVMVGTILLFNSHFRLGWLGYGGREREGKGREGKEMI